MKRLIGLMLGLLTGLAGAFLTPSAVSAAPTWCHDGWYCVDESMQSLNGAGMLAHADFSVTAPLLPGPRRTGRHPRHGRRHRYQRRAMAA
jgi:hypothetical protein